MAATLGTNPPAGPAGAPEGTGLEVRDLKVFHGVVPAVRGVDLECKPGRILGIVGPNGAGKTSLLSGIAG
ncbi:MAG TPA: ATP-binding cassette domain-containing protein, partial [Acidimicrobiia bacterium]|nr:ATP-binding cassette domain-containing protein [Acidimicrobiia bacterium]